MSLKIFVLLILVGIGVAQDRPKVAVKTFENPSNLSQSTIGNGLTDILITELENTGKFSVLERANVDELTREMDFGSSEYAKTSTFAKKGNMLGAQYVLMGKVTNFGYAEHAQSEERVNLLGPNSVETVYLQKADVRVDFRLVDVGTGETVLSQAGEAHKANKSEVSEMQAWYRCTTTGSITAEASSSLIGRTTTEAVKDVVRKLNTLSETIRQRGAGSALTANLEILEAAKGQIVADEGGGLWIVGGIGNSSGLRKGDHLRLVRESPIKDKSGKVVYRKAVDVGSMEVTDVSQPDSSEARYLSNPNPGAGPQVNDAVSVDAEYARTLRNGAPAAGNGGNSPGSSGTSIAGGDPLEQLLKRADSYLEDRLWSQALDEYKQAAAVNAGHPRVLQGQAVSHYMLGDFIEGDDMAQRLLEVGASLSVPVAHYHSMGICTGELAIQKGKLAYVSNKSDGFEIAPSSLAAVEVRKIAKGMMANERLPDWPVLELRWRDAGGHEKKYQMIPYGYSKQQLLTGRNFASAFPMDDNDVQQMQKLERSLLGLIQKYVR